MDINQNYREAVQVIKEAILRSQYRAVASVNKEQLSLYYGIGRYVSVNSRKDFWGKGAIEQISTILQKELPGLRGFSATSIRNMRIFYEEWDKVLNHPPTADEFNWGDFLSIGFSHHTEIISKAKTLEARLFYDRLYLRRPVSAAHAADRCTGCPELDLTLKGINLVYRKQNRKGVK